MKTVKEFRYEVDIGEVPDAPGIHEHKEGMTYLPFTIEITTPTGKYTKLFGGDLSTEIYQEFRVARWHTVERAEVPYKVLAAFYTMFTHVADENADLDTLILSTEAMTLSYSQRRNGVQSFSVPFGDKALAVTLQMKEGQPGRAFSAIEDSPSGAIEETLHQYYEHYPEEEDFASVTCPDCIKGSHGPGGHLRLVKE